MKLAILLHQLLARICFMHQGLKWHLRLSCIKQQILLISHFCDLKFIFETNYFQIEYQEKLETHFGYFTKYYKLSCVLWWKVYICSYDPLAFRHFQNGSCKTIVSGTCDPLPLNENYIVQTCKQIFYDFKYEPITFQSFDIKFMLFLMNISL